MTSNAGEGLPQQRESLERSIDPFEGMCFSFWRFVRNNGIAFPNKP